MKNTTIAVASLVMVACNVDVGPLRSDLAPSADAAALDSGASEARDGGAAPAAEVSFARDIRPILARSDGPPAGCKRCHYRDAPAAQGYEIGGLDMTTLGTLRRGGVSSGTSIVVPGDPDRSALVQKLEGTYPRGARMPKDLPPLPRAEIDLIRRWIAAGARGANDE